MTEAFGRVWKLRTDDDLCGYTERHRPGLAALLLFELAHEGRPTREMERGRAGGVGPDFATWSDHLRRAR